MIEKVIDALRGLFDFAQTSKLPTVIQLNYSDDCPKSGLDAGKLVLKKSSDEFQYELQTSSDKFCYEHKAEYEINHKFGDVKSLASYLELRKKTPFKVFASKSESLAYGIYAIDEFCPENGSLQSEVDLHPIFLEWREFFMGFRQSLFTHKELADFLLDQAEQLEEPALADHMAAFRAARTIEYDADLGGKGYEGVRITWKGSGGQKGAKEDFKVPRQFKASMPIHVGPWDPGNEPIYELSFTIRVVPPKDDRAEPQFKIKWVNSKETDLQSRINLFEQMRKLFSHPVYCGSPLAKHYIVGKK